MRPIFIAVCAAASVLVGASASGQSDADEQQGAVPRDEIEQLRRELEQARESLEAAARDLASRSVPVPATSAVTSVFVGGGLSWTRLGAALVDAEGGALVTEVAPGGRAEDAGIRVGDLIQSIDGLDLSAEDSPSAGILERIAEIEPGDSVTLAVERTGEVLEYDVEVEEGYGWSPAPLQPAQGQFQVIRPNGLTLFRSERAEGSDEPGGPVIFGDQGVRVYALPRLRSLNLAASAWGEMELVPMTTELARYFGTQEGLLVIRGPSEESIGIEDGDVILAIGGRPPSSPEHAIRILASFEPGETIEFSIMRQGGRQTVQYVVP